MSAEPETAIYPPTREQAAAIAARDRDVFCEAGAGTGKTRVLVGRYCDALTGDEAGIDEILAFTFTERAASELRQRIRRELSRRSRLAKDAGDEERATELRRLARETERAWVTTIHGFCRRLLGTHPVAAGLDPRFRVLDASEAGRLREQAAREAIQRLVADGSEDVARTAASYQAWRVAKIALIAHERLRNQGMTHPRLPEVSEPTDVSTKKEKDKRPLRQDEREDAIRARNAFDSVLEEIDRRYSELKSARSGLDFSDLELLAVEVLATSVEVRELWRGRFRHVMVDEFQDTNRVQLELVEALRGPETKLFTVGDEHQSIYRFRNADLEVFRERKREAAASGTTDVLPLRGNFRSKAPILDAANTLGEVLLDGFTPLAAGDPAKQILDAPDVELLLTMNEGRGANHIKWADHAETLKMPESEGIPHTVAQARALAERLRELVDSKEAKAGEIVVLLRAFTHVDAYEEALRRYGLEPYVVGGRGYWSQQQVEDLLRLLGCVANPLDDEMLLGALACPAAAVSPDALWLLRAAAGKGSHLWPVVEYAFGDGDGFEPEEPAWLEKVPEDDAERLRQFCKRLLALRAEAPLLPLDVLVERTMNAFAYDISLLGGSQPVGRMANVRKLMRLAAEFERNEGRDLRTFLVQAAESTKRDEREGLAPVQPEEHDGVRIMTVHGAKGLEFPVVAVPELDRVLDIAHNSEDIWIGRPSDDGSPARFGLRLAFPTSKSIGAWELTELDAEEKEAEAEESCRLVYVAVTRAQERLILSGVYKPAQLEEPSERKTNDTALTRLLPALAAAGWDGGEGRVDAPVPMRIRISNPSEARALELTPAPAVTAAAQVEALVVPPLLEQERATVSLGHLSYSALDAYKRCGYRFYVERVLGVRAGLVTTTPDGSEDADPEAEGRAADELPDPESPQVVTGPASPALALGNAVHAALEWSARSGWETPGTDRLEALLGLEGLGGDTEALTRATRLIDGWLESDLCRSVGNAKLRPEAPFVLPLAGTILRGSIDLLATDSGATTVVDFKTDRVGSDGVGPLGERYSSQRAVYALAVAGIRPEAPIRTAHVFLERPSEPVLEEFDPDDLARARASLEGLIAQIRAGDFEPTRDPYAALCLGCPAAPRLCPRPAWRPPRTAPATVR
ncbi:MAG TPA: UvrD-helicase domain-containing protein [Solirubrobacterales bacterium]|nr:UvrD-helicase domain-containing protein [Solirubrobacterales bacterium]